MVAITTMIATTAVTATRPEVITNWAIGFNPTFHLTQFRPCRAEKHFHLGQLIHPTDALNPRSNEVTNSARFIPLSWRFMCPPSRPAERWLFVQNWASISSGLVRLRIDSAGVPSDGRQSHHGVAGAGLVVIIVDVEVGLGV
jgi:hypothetical protein